MQQTKKTKSKSAGQPHISRAFSQHESHAACNTAPTAQTATAAIQTDLTSGKAVGPPVSGLATLETA